MFRTPRLARSLIQSSARAFSLTELMVVIGIIVLLVGLLLVALGQVQKKARRTQTENTMHQFANACMEFQSEQRVYPGVIPDEFVSYANKPFSSTENALLHLMGGCRVLSPTDSAGGQVALDYDNFKILAQSTNSAIEYTFTNPSGQTWMLVVDLRKIGEGPVVNGKPRAPYFTPGASDLRAVAGQIGPGGSAADPQLPDLVDAWGQPIIYVHRVRDRGPIVLDTVTAGAGRPQFLLTGVYAYLGWPNPPSAPTSLFLGEMGQDQLQSMLHVGTVDQQNKAFAAILANPAMYKFPNPPPPGVPGNPLNSAPRGAFMLLSAGADGIYFSTKDGPGTETAPITGSNINTLIIDIGPKVIDEFDDIRVFGGG